MQNIIELFTKQREALLKEFCEISSKVIDDTKVFEYEHFSKPITAQIVLFYGAETMINRPPVEDMIFTIQAKDSSMQEDVEKQYTVA